MSTITLPNIRVSSDLTVGLKLKDGGVAIDWSTLSNIRVSIYADAQRSLAGRCTVAIDETDSTVLVCQYAANKPQYLGVNRVIVQCTYMGETKTYDKPAFTFVRWTDDQTGEEITISDPDIDVEIEVEDVSSSILNQAIAAALQAAEDAEHAAHLIPNQVLLDCEQATSDANAAAAAANAAGITSVQVSVEDNEPGTPSAECSLANKVLSIIFHYLKGATGDAAGFGAITATVDDVVGNPSVTVTASGPDTAKVLSFAFHGLRGIQGEPGVANAKYKQVDTLPTASASTMDFIYLTPSGTSGIYNMSYTEQDGSTYSWQDLGTTAIQLSDYATKAELSQLDLEVNGFNTTTEVLTPKSLTADKYFNTNVSTMATSPSANEGFYCCKISVTPGDVYRIHGLQGTSNYTLLFATADSARARKRRASTGSNTRITLDVTIEEGEAYLYCNLGSYDSQTDGVWKVTNVTEHTDGLADDVDNLEDAVDEINGNAVTTETAQEVLFDKYINMGLNALKGRNNLPSSVGDACCYIYVKPGEKYNIYGEGTSAYLGLYCFADAKLNIKYKSGAMNTRTNGLVVEIPEGIEILGVNLIAYDSDTDKVEKITTTNVSGYKAYIDTECVSILKPFVGKKIVVFGDSITENTYNGKHYSDYIADITGATVINVGVGGTQLRQRTTPVDTPTSTLEAYAALDIVNMVKASCDGVFTQQTNAAQYLKDNASDDNTAIVTALSNIDWSDVWLVIVFGGTNDWKNAGENLGTTGSSNVNKTLGATNEIIRMLLTAYPYLLIQFVSPIVRWIGYSGGTGTDANWGDTYTNAGGITLKEFVAILGNEVELNHIPFEDIYNDLGWNKTNFAEYFGENDGTHPTYGLRFIGRKIARHLLATLQY